MFGVFGCKRGGGVAEGRQDGPTGWSQWGECYSDY